MRDTLTMFHLDTSGFVFMRIDVFVYLTYCSNFKILFIARCVTMSINVYKSCIKTELTAIAGHGLKSIDLVCMKKLDTKVNIIPIIAKADTISKTELQKFKVK